MSVDLFKVRDAERPPRVLVVDDDKRVLELLEIAFSAHGFTVVTAADGDEALRRAQSDRPDLVVLDVRLPRKSGLEVCEGLRKDPDEPHVPIILVSAAIEPETRLQAFRRGADDYLAKPFSPKELIARARRLITRAAEAREARLRTRDLERELHRAHDDARRAQLETRRERRLRDLTFGLGRELHLALDPDELAHRLLPSLQFRFGVGIAALLLPADEAEPGGPWLRPAVVRGEDRARLAALTLAAGGPLVTLVTGLRRPVRTRELQRFPELGDEGAPLLACGIALLAALPGPRGLEGMLALDERLDGRDLLPEELELLGAACEVAGTALHNACRVRGQSDRLIAAAAGPRAAPGGRAAAERLVATARHAGIEPRLFGLLAHVARLGGIGRARLRLAGWAVDPLTGSRVAALRDLLDATRNPAAARDADVRRAAALLVMAEAWRAGRRRGLGAAMCLAMAAEPLGDAVDPPLLAAFEATFLPDGE